MLVKKGKSTITPQYNIANFLFFFLFVYYDSNTTFEIIIKNQQKKRGILI